MGRQFFKSIVEFPLQYGGFLLNIHTSIAHNSHAPGLEELYDFRDMVTLDDHMVC